MAGRTGARGATGSPGVGSSVRPWVWFMLGLMTGTAPLLWRENVSDTTSPGVAETKILAMSHRRSSSCRDSTGGGTSVVAAAADAVATVPAVEWPIHRGGGALEFETWRRVQQGGNRPSVHDAAHPIVPHPPHWSQKKQSDRHSSPPTHPPNTILAWFSLYTSQILPHLPSLALIPKVIGAILLEYVGLPIQRTCNSSNLDERGPTFPTPCLIHA